MIAPKELLHLDASVLPGAEDFFVLLGVEPPFVGVPVVVFISL